MATLYANSSGNWNAAIWYDVATGQPYAEGTPQEGDIVYSNGYTVTLNVNINIGNGVLTNALCSYTNRSGGTFRTNANNRTVVANIDAYNYNTCLSQSSSGYYITLIGNLTSHNATYYATNACIRINGNVNGNMAVNFIRGTVAAYDYELIINGNVTGESGKVINVDGSNPSSGYYTGVTINGNVINASINFVPTGTRKVTINGNWRNESAPTMLVNLADLVITGDFCNLSNKFTVTNFTVGGNIYYNVDFGNFVATNINYINPTSQQWINRGTSPFQIVNSNTGIDYPSESYVKIGIEYAYGQKVGTYTHDYPPESVVLKDYEYGDSDDRKTGTMPVLSQQLISRLENCATVETVQQLLVAHLDN